MNITILNSPHIADDGVVSFYDNAGQEIKLLYSVAQQAMLGRWAIDRYVTGSITNPYAEWIDPCIAPSPLSDKYAADAVNWLANNVTITKNGGAIWGHSFDYVHSLNAPTTCAPWGSAVSQAYILLSLLHWWEHTQDGKWKILAEQAIIPFTTPLSSLGGLCYSFGDETVWFEEYPASLPTHVLNAHLLSLIALDRAAKLLDSSNAKNAFLLGWQALRRRIQQYKRAHLSRYEINNLLFMCLRLVPSHTGTAAIGKIKFSTKDGLTLAAFDCTTSNTTDNYGHRLAGIDWGPVINCAGKQARLIPNVQHIYADSTPAGGTDQNTYFVFEGSVDNLLCANGFSLEAELYLENGASLALEAEQLERRLEFTPLAHQPQSIDGWQTFVWNIDEKHNGLPLPAHYHRLHLELLGTLLKAHPDSLLQYVFDEWYSQSPAFSCKNSQYPDNIFVVLNNTCNLHCKMCDVGQKSKDASLYKNLRSPDKTFKLDNFFESIKNADYSQICVVGTEPLLYGDLEKFINTAASQPVHVTTNALLLEHKASMLADSNLSGLTISIDGPPDIHDEVRGHTGLFNAIKNGLAAFRDECVIRKKLPPPLSINFTLTYQNHTRIIDFLESVKPFAPASICISHLNFVTPEIADRHNSRFPDYPIFPSAVTAWEDSLKMDFLTLFNQLEEAKKISWTQMSFVPDLQTPTKLLWYYTRPTLPMGRYLCAAPWYSIQILCDGTVTILSRCFDTKLGNIFEENLNEIWQGEKYNQFRKFIQENAGQLEACQRCCGLL